MVDIGHDFGLVNTEFTFLKRQCLYVSLSVFKHALILFILLKTQIHGELKHARKVRLVKAVVFPVVMYGCESWAVKKAEHRRIDAFEL